MRIIDENQVIKFIQSHDGTTSVDILDYLKKDRSKKRNYDKEKIKEIKEDLSYNLLFTSIKHRSAFSKKK